MLRNLVTIVGNIIFLFVMSWKLSLSVMIILPFFVANTLYYSKRYKPLVKEYSDVNAEMSAHVSEKFAGIQLVKAYSNEDKEI
jgi:ABC-type multidrug transport system fused ATPase/permease subunit